ncbi:MAG: winged helix DNA-binding domain-containing protein [Bacteroidales bacterium]|nr:winged helix DNA-binding domain-containing protein [Bacteroidales bacterium]
MYSGTGNSEFHQKVFLLPAYDEFLIGYKNRSAVISKNINAKIISINGLFRPVILVNGQVAGIWKRTIKGNTCTFETELFFPMEEFMNESIQGESKRYGDFLGKVVR